MQPSPRLSSPGAAIAGAPNNLNGELTSDLSEMQGSATSEVGSYMLLAYRVMYFASCKSISFVVY